MSLTLGSQPGFTEISDSSFDAGNVPSDSLMKSLNAAAKFGVVRNEQFFGFYKNGDTVVLPTSPADGYTYQRSELMYLAMPYWSGSPTSFTPGTMTPPAGGPTSGAGTLLQFGYWVDQSTGVVHTVASYFKTAQTDTLDGILLVLTLAMRSR